MNSLFEYKKIDDGISITNYLGKEKHLVIPEEIDGNPVTEIDDYALIDKKIESIDLCNVTFLGNYALAYNNIKKINLLNTAYLGQCVLDGNNLGLLLLPSSMKYNIRVDNVFDMTIEELDELNNNYVKKYMKEKREKYFKKLYKNSIISELICENIVNYMYKDVLFSDEMMLEIM